VRSTDALTYVAVTTILVTVALAATFIPARRAAWWIRCARSAVSRRL
jgi:hypothetical protein